MLQLPDDVRPCWCARTATTHLSRDPFMLTLCGRAVDRFPHALRAAKWCRRCVDELHQPTHLPTGKGT